MEKALKLNPKNVRALGTLGLVQVALGDVVQGIKSINKSIEVDPDFTKGYIQLASVLAEQQMWEQAESFFERISNLPNFNDVLVHYVTVVSETSGKLDKALDAVCKRLKKMPNDIRMIRTKAKLQTFAGDLESSLKSYDLALQLDPNAKLTLVGCAEVLSLMGRDQEALEVLGKILDQDPHYLPALELASDISGKLPPGGIQLLNHNPDDHQALFAKGFALASSKDFAGALECFRQVYKMVPGYTGVMRRKISERFLHFATTLEKEGGTIEMALEFYDMAVQTDKRSAKPLAMKAIALFRSTRLKEALEHIERSMKLDPSFMQLPLLEVAMLSHEQLEQWTELLETIDRIIKINPKEEERLASVRSNAKHNLEDSSLWNSVRKWIWK